MAVILTAPTDPGTAAWTTGEDVTAGSIDTDDTTAATDASNATSVRTGNTLDGNSGSITVRSGTTASATGIRGSGALTIASGVTESSAGFNGGASGNIVVGSGDALSTTAGTSGSSGTVTIESGASDDANSGVITIAGGAAASGVRGNIDIVGLRVFPGVNTTEIITGTVTMAPADGGATYEIDKSGGNVIINLPVAVAGNRGASYTFVLIGGAAGANTATITPGGNFLRGTAIAGGASVVAVSHANILYQATNAQAGDTVRVTSTGNVWLCEAVGSNAASWTLS